MEELQERISRLENRKTAEENIERDITVPDWFLQFYFFTFCLTFCPDNFSFLFSPFLFPSLFFSLIK